MVVVVEPGAGGELAWWCHPTIESGFRVVDARWWRRGAPTVDGFRGGRTGGGQRHSGRG
jgi:hypothetical protein